MQVESRSGPVGARRGSVHARRRAIAVALVAVLGLTLVACSGDDESGAPRVTTPGTVTPVDVEGLPAADVTVIPGTQEVTVTGLPAGEPVTLLAEDGTPLLTLLADDAGQAHTAYVPDEHLTVETGHDNIIPTAVGQSLKPGTYRVTVGEGEAMAVTAPFEVTGVDDHPDESHYDQTVGTVQVSVLGEPTEGQTLEDGFGYLEMRDGTLLSAMVRLPDPTVYGEGPYPTVVEYSGYDPISNPNGQEPGSRIMAALGYATVGVSMRGTGCSGGAFDVFSPSQQADGYDVIEIVGRQPWVKGAKVGMVGLSYSGISQLYTAATNPPHLAAITPQSTIVDPWLQQWPGGIYNSGFTKQWLAQRDADAAAGGVEWVQERVDGGDETCAANLTLRSQNVDFESFGRSLPFRPDDSDERDLRELVRRIDVPVLYTGAFQDEQTGPLFTGMLDHFDAAPLLRVRMWNGRHPDGYSPMNTRAWHEFLELYVDDEVPFIDPLLELGLPIELANAFELQTADLGPDEWAGFDGDLAAAQARYEAEDPVEIIFESGAGGDEPGEPGGTFTETFTEWPTSLASPRTWYLGADGALTDAEAAEDGADTFRHDPAAGAEDFFGEAGYELFPPLWDADWTRFAEGDAVTYITDPVPEDLVLGGPGEVVLWVGSEADDADLQVTLTEVRPDDTEVLLQSGYLRVSHRAVDEERSAPLRVEHVWTEDAAEPIPPGELVEARIALPSVAAPVRAGSRLQLQVSSPGRNHGTWLFESPYGEGEAPRHRIGRGPATPSSITLSLLDGVAVPAGQPACGVLRGQVCRAYAPTANQAD